MCGGCAAQCSILGALRLTSETNYGAIRATTRTYDVTIDGVREGMKKTEEERPKHCLLCECKSKRSRREPYETSSTEKLEKEWIARICGCVARICVSCVAVCVVVFWWRGNKGRRHHDWANLGIIYSALTRRARGGTTQAEIDAVRTANNMRCMLFACGDQTRACKCRLCRQNDSNTNPTSKLAARKRSLIICELPPGNGTAARLCEINPLSSPELRNFPLLKVLANIFHIYIYLRTLQHVVCVGWTQTARAACLVY